MLEWLGNLVSFFWNLSDDWLKTGLIIGAIVQGLFLLSLWAFPHKESKNEQPQPPPTDSTAEQPSGKENKPEEPAVTCKSKFSDLLQTFKKSKKNKEKKKKR